MSKVHPNDRRQFRRVSAPVVWRAARLRDVARTVVDISLGGIRLYSDDAVRVGDAIEIEVFVGRDESLKCLGRVAWILELAPGGPARFDIGLAFLELPAGGLHLLNRVVRADAAESEDPGKPSER